MDNNALQKIRETLTNSQNVTFVVSKNPTLDQMAACLSLALSLEAQGKKVAVLSPTEPIVEISSLVGIDRVRTSNEGSGGDLVVSFPYREGEIEKVSYTIDDGALNIVVKAGEAGLTFSEKDVTFKRSSGKPDLIVSVGVTRLNEVEAFFTPEDLDQVTVINIDNTNENEGYGAMVLVSAKFSSLSEQVADLLLNLGFDIDIDAAQNMLSGITAATDNFQKPNTSYLAFEIAAILMKRGANRGRETAPRRQPLPSSQMGPQLNRSQHQPNQPQQQQNRREDRQDRRDAIRDALRTQTQMRHDTPRPDQSRDDRPAAAPQAPQNKNSEQKPPSDWLTPKVYKGSTNV
ncbi:MAG TPA: hypothetical protein VG935_01285 [Patescibacteria group bacterium]|nr:hypothetical protein [Patescibacteria group bacterium]